MHLPHAWPFVRALAVAAFACALWLAVPARAEAQLGSLVSPGRLTPPHAALEGLSNCTKCHEQGQRVTVEKCIACHRPVAERMARGVGVHRDVKGDCVRCHVEHTGEKGNLRPFDTQRFDHAAVTGFPLDGRHATVAANCAACHKTRSFLTASASCASCHNDVHKGALGQNCATCHSTRAAFKEAVSGFDHSKTSFPLTGSHRTVACATCHVNRTYTGVKFAACSDCHRDPHREPPGATCATCHTTDTWRTKKIDHRRTAFPLIGRHAAVECVSCHVQPALRVRPKADTCAACHVDVHRGAFPGKDCKACHSESGFGKAPFDHSKTAFALTGKHAPLACIACHTSITKAAVPASRRTVAFGGLKSACVTCHNDVHAGELGTTCETCHSSTTFKVSGYVHPRFPDFFAGSHASLACEKCHVREMPTRPVSTRAVLAVRFKAATTTCVACHRDVHLGQEGQSCETCHSVQVAAFKAPGFSHERARFALTGRHQAATCAQCHKRETAQYPAGVGEAVHYRGIATDCRACHADVHLGQLDTRCESCHTTSSFTLPGYKHRRASLASLFVGRHAALACAACHQTVTGAFPAGRGTAMRFKVDATCVSCHTDVHRGALGPNCAECHRP